MKKFLVLLGVLGILLFSSQAQAVIILDTGTVPAETHGGPVLTGGLGGSYQWLAGKFTLGQAYTLTDIEGWITTGYYSSAASTLTLAIYSDAGAIPDNDTDIYSDGFTVAGTSQITSDWYGLSGLSLPLGPGAYWAAFEIRQGQFYDGYMAHHVPSPLSDYAYANQSSSEYVAWPGADFGLRIQGIPGDGGCGDEGCPVPEPASLSLLGLGLIGLIRKRRIS